MGSIETLATVILVSVALLPLVSYAVRKCGVGRRTLAYGLLFGLTGSVLWIANSVRPTVAKEADVTERPIQTPSDGYVSSNSCRACHPNYHATWHHSYHSKMTQLASTASVAGDFNNVELERGDARYRLTKQDGEFFVGIKSVSQPKRDYPRRKIVMTTGSHHRQWVWMETGDTRKIAPLPFLYLIPQQRWIPLESSFLLPPDLKLGFPKGAWNENCIQCHTTQGRMRKQHPAPGVVAMDTRVAEFAIACESCHGPAEKHILANRDPVRRHRLRTHQEPDPTIVNPARLTPELSAQVCGQCHAALSLYKSKDRGTYNHWNNEGFDYRPGRDLKDSRYLFGYKPHMESHFIRSFVASEPSYVPNRFWSDGVIRIAGREFSGLLATPCYTHGDPSKQMSCLSCHAMHQPEDDDRSVTEWANDQLKPDMAGNRACTQCHDDFTSKGQLEAHTHHAASSAASLCYNCHMPYTTFGLLKAIRSHGLVSPNVQSSIDTGRPNACNQCHLDRTLEWTADYLHTWHDLAKPELSDDQRQIAASVLWTLKGDAGQRALMAWSMGWKDARDASGTNWMAPYLAELLTDPYDAVRFVAHESLGKSPDYSQLKYDFLGPPAERILAAEQVRDRWSRQQAGKGTADRDALLIDPQSQLRQDVIDRLLRERDQRPVNLQE